MAATMAFDVVFGWELWITGDPEGLNVLFGLVVLDLNFLLLILAVLNGSHQAIQHIHVSDLGAGCFSVCSGTYRACALGR